MRDILIRLRVPALAQEQFACASPAEFLDGALTAAAVLLRSRRVRGGPAYFVFEVRREPAERDLRSWVPIGPVDAIWLRDLASFGELVDENAAGWFQEALLAR